MPDPLRILYRDEAVLAVDKPSGVLTVPGRAPSKEGEPAPLWAQVQGVAADALPVHRLDRETSGVVLFALGTAAQRALSSSLEDRKAEKIYLALVRGDLPAEVRCDLALHEARAGGMRVARPGEVGGKPSRTDFTPLERFGSYTWVRCRPHTGRTHQIRVHLAALGHPLAIDARYGDAGPLPEWGLARLALHAASIRVPHPDGERWLLVESPLPDDLQQALHRLRAERRSR